jgi:hypothetical protein
MADQRFDYPTAAAPTASLVWTRGAQLVEDTPRMNLNQKAKRTPGGTLRVKSYGDPNELYPVTTIFAESSESEADMADVYAFVTTHIEGGVNTFQWTDSAGTVRTVRMTNEDVLNFPKFGHDSRKFQWILEKI